MQGWALENTVCCGCFWRFELVDSSPQLYSSDSFVKDSYRKDRFRGENTSQLVTLYTQLSADLTINLWARSKARSISAPPP